MTRDVNHFQLVVDHHLLGIEVLQEPQRLLVAISAIRPFKSQGRFCTTLEVPNFILPFEIL